jgi:hypothetical protein
MELVIHYQMWKAPTARRGTFIYMPVYNTPSNKVKNAWGFTSTHLMQLHCMMHTCMGTLDLLYCNHTYVIMKQIFRHHILCCTNIALWHKWTYAVQHSVIENLGANLRTSNSNKRIILMKTVDGKHTLLIRHPIREVKQPCSSNP